MGMYCGAAGGQAGGRLRLRRLAAAAAVHLAQGRQAARRTQLQPGQVPLKVVRWHATAAPPPAGPLLVGWLAAGLPCPHLQVLLRVVAAGLEEGGQALLNLIVPAGSARQARRVCGCRMRAVAGSSLGRKLRAPWRWRRRACARPPGGGGAVAPRAAAHRPLSQPPEGVATLGSSSLFTTTTSLTTPSVLASCGGGGGASAAAWGELRCQRSRCGQ